MIENQLVYLNQTFNRLQLLPGVGSKVSGGRFSARWVGKTSHGSNANQVSSMDLTVLIVGSIAP